MGVWAAVCADKGSPGASTVALLLAAGNPAISVVVEVDPAGGDVAPRLFAATGHVQPPAANLLTLASAARHAGADPGLVGAHAAMTPLGVPLVAGLAIADQQAGLGALWPVLATALAASERPIVADLGRVWSAHPALAVAAAARHVVIVVRPALEELLRLRDRARQLLAVCGGDASRLTVAVVGPAKAAARDQAAVAKLLAEAGVLGVRVGWVCAHPKELAAFWRGQPNRRGPLWRSAQALGASLGATASAPSVVAKPAEAAGFATTGETAWTTS
jgi:hypothetical protein